MDYDMKRQIAKLMSTSESGKTTDTWE